MKKGCHTGMTVCLLAGAFLFFCGMNGCGALNTVSSINSNMVPVSGNTFEMGCSPGDALCYSDESPRHSVTLSPFEIGRYEVTQGQWKAVMGGNPSSHDDCGDNCPVENVSWEDVQTFLDALNLRTGSSYRLCTEAEWEYAARAGTETRWYCGDNESCLDDIAWYFDNSFDAGDTSQHPVGQKAPNAWDLYDMIGNVWEWVNDWQGDYSASSVTDPTGPESGSERVVRGGAWTFQTSHCRSSARYDYAPSYDGSFLGFRLCRSPE